MEFTNLGLGGYEMQTGKEYGRTILPYPPKLEGTSSFAQSLLR